MKYLFEEDDHGNLEYAPQVLAIKEFRDLWESHTSKDLAFRELSAVYFFTDIRSTYMRVDEEERWTEIGADIFEDENWKPSELVLLCVNKYNQLSRTPSMDTLDAARQTQKELDRFLKEVDLNERDRNGKTVHNAKQIMDMIKSLPDTVEAMQKTQRLVDTEIAENLQLRGGREKAEFEDDDANPD